MRDRVVIIVVPRVMLAVLVVHRGWTRIEALRESVWDALLFVRNASRHNRECSRAHCAAK